MGNPQVDGPMDDQQPAGQDAGVEASGLDGIRETFAHYFEHWHITLPEDLGVEHPRGAIQGAGWSIQYLLDHETDGDYLDFYATHRMTNDRHMRIYASGETKDLPAEQEFMVFPANSTPDEQQRIEQEYYAYNRQVGEELKRKGFR